MPEHSPVVIPVQDMKDDPGWLPAKFEVGEVCLLLFSLNAFTAFPSKRDPQLPPPNSAHTLIL